MAEKFKNPPGKKKETKQNVEKKIPASGALKKIDEYEQSKPVQLSLFEMLSPKDREFSNTIELYDFIPKYFWGKSQRINGKFLEQLEREFECRTVRYKVKIDPAKISDRDGVTRDTIHQKGKSWSKTRCESSPAKVKGFFSTIRQA